MSLRFHVGHTTVGCHATAAAHCDIHRVVSVCLCCPLDGASFPESAAEHEGPTGAIRLYKPQSAELRSFSQNLVWKRVW